MIIAIRFSLAVFFSVLFSYASAQTEAMLGLNFLQTRNTQHLTVENNTPPGGNLSISTKGSLAKHPTFGYKLVIDCFSARSFIQKGLSESKVNLVSLNAAFFVTHNIAFTHTIGVGPNVQSYYASNVKKWRRIYNATDYGINGFYQAQLLQNMGIGIRGFIGFNNLFEYARIDELGNILPEKSYFKSIIITPYISITL